jgi:oxygen-dependent protoporphyrinogen oxidase
MKDVVVIGAGLTGLSTAHHLRKANFDVLVLEQKNRIGGVINSTQEDGFLYEEGPNSGVIGNVEVLRLFDDLKGYCEIEVANDNVKKRFILKKGKWEALPSGLMSAVKTPLFTLKDKFRILGEPWRSKGTNPHETLADLVKRRMGNSFLDYAIDPFIIGVYAGDPGKLVPKYALPKLYNLEQNYGSFIKGAAKKKKEPKTEEEKRADRSVFSAKGGLVNILNGLNKTVGSNNINLDVSSIVVEPKDNHFIVKYTQGQQNFEIETKQVITTTGSYQLKSLLPFIDKSKIDKISNLHYTNVIEIVLGFKQWQGIALNGFGGLIPFKENRDILGVLYMSSLFENRAPKDGVLFSIFMGGVRRPELYKLEEAEVKTLVEKEICELMGLKTFKPDLFKIIKHQYAIPQYEANSGERFESIESIEKEYKGLIIGGNLRDGIGMADRILQAKEIASSAIEYSNNN